MIIHNSVHLGGIYPEKEEMPLCVTSCPL